MGDLKSIQNLLHILPRMYQCLKGHINFQGAGQWGLSYHHPNMLASAIYPHSHTKLILKYCSVLLFSATKPQGHVLPDPAKKVSSSRVINNPTLPRNEGFPQKWEFQYSNQESLGQAGMMITLSSSPTLYQCSSAACKKPLKTLLELSLRQLYKSISGFLSETFHFYGSWSILDTGEFYKLVTFFGLIEERRNLFPLVLDSPKLLGFMNISHCK